MLRMLLIASYIPNSSDGPISHTLPIFFGYSGLSWANEKNEDASHRLVHMMLPEYRI